MLQQRPNMESVWGSQGNTSAPSQEKVLEGWVEEIPLNIVANWIENRQDKALLYLFQKGIAEWSSNTDYPNRCLTQQDGVYYLSKVPSKGASPKDTPLAWGIAFDEYGASAAVMEVVRKLIEEEGELPLYVSKSAPVFDAPAVGKSFKADEGLPSTLEGGNAVGHTFNEADNSGMFLNGGLLSLMNSGALGLLIRTVIPESSNDQTAVTTKYLKGFLTQNDNEHDVLEQEIESLKSKLNGLNLESSLEANGYIKFPFGLIIQWGKNAEPLAGSGNIEFSKRFSSKPFYLNASCEHDTAIHDGQMAVTKIRSSNASGFVYASGVESGDNDVFNAAGLAFTWLAIGMSAI